MVYAVFTVTRGKSKVQKRENSMWVHIQGVYSVSKNRSHNLNAKKNLGGKILKKVVKKKVIRIFERKKCSILG